MPENTPENAPEKSMHRSWEAPLSNALGSDIMQTLRAFLKAEKAAGKPIYPQQSNWFRALELTPLNQLRVVILGQDPYHGDGQAHGLCFSVQPEMRIPPSLANIYKEMQADLGISPARHGFLEHWARQGVLLLNSVLTVEAHKAASHKKRGWEEFTDAVITCINESETPTVFLLWGAYAQKKAAFVDANRHLVLKAAHPSPLAAYKGFFGCAHFSKTNEFLAEKGLPQINWELPAL